MDGVREAKNHGVQIAFFSMPKDNCIICRTNCAAVQEAGLHHGAVPELRLRPLHEQSVRGSDQSPLQERLSSGWPPQHPSPRTREAPHALVLISLAHPFWTGLFRNNFPDPNPRPDPTLLTL